MSVELWVKIEVRRGRYAHRTRILRLGAWAYDQHPGEHGESRSQKRHRQTVSG